MATIRVDPAILHQAANDIARVAEQVLAVGNQLYQATQGQPTYDGEFGPQVASVGREGLARARALADRLLERSAWLSARAAAFQTVDAATLQCLASIQHELLAWIHGQPVTPLADVLLPEGWNDRPPPGIPEQDWQGLTPAEKIAIWVGALRGVGEPDETVPVPVPPPLTPDPGSGEFGSMEPTLADYAFEQLLLYGAAGWEVGLSRPDAARHMRHYLEGTGEPLEVDVERMLEDMPRLRTQSQTDFDTFVRDVENRVKQEYHGQPIQLQVVSGWIESPYPEDQNWYFATGRFSYAFGAVVTVSPPSTPGAGPTVEVAHRMYVWDYYNWDTGKSVTIPRTLPGTDIPVSLPIPEEYQTHIREVANNWVVADTGPARLHMAGLAREYEIMGQTEASTLHLTFDSQTQQLVPGLAPGTGPEAGR